MLSLHSSHRQTRKSTTSYRFNPRNIETVPGYPRFWWVDILRFHHIKSLMWAFEYGKTNLFLHSFAMSRIYGYLSFACVIQFQSKYILSIVRFHSFQKYLVGTSSATVIGSSSGISYRFRVWSERKMLLRVYANDCKVFSLSEGFS